MTRASISFCLVLTFAATAQPGGGGYGHYGHHGGGSGLRVGLAKMEADGKVRIREIHAGPQMSQRVKVRKEQDGKLWEEDVDVKHTHISEHIIHLDARALKVFDVDSKPVPQALVSELLQREIPVVLSDPDRKMDRRLLPILKKGALIVVLPMHGHGHGYNGDVVVPVPAKKMPEKIVPPPAKKVPVGEDD